MSLSPELTALAQSYGVATEYWDWKGHRVEVSGETVHRVLAAMGVHADDPAEALRRRHEEPWLRMLPPCVVAVRGEPHRFWVHVDHGAPAEAFVTLEGGTELRVPQVEHWVDPRHVGDRLVGEATFELPGDLPLGYHTLRAVSGESSATAPLVVTPAWLGLPDRLADGHGWGFAVQLYSVRSHRSWGVGDLADLADLAVWSAADLAADFVLVNPLHAAEPTAPMEPSPYLPASRQFFNPLYVRVDRVPEYADLPARARATVDGLATGVHLDLDDADVIDRDTAWTAKRAALELVHEVPRSIGREKDFRAFCRRGGEALRDFATWRVLALEHGTDHRTWPAELQDPASPAVMAVRDAHADAVDLEMWLQWVLDEQLQSAQARAVSAGMALGTMHDLAVGVHPGGADAWRLRSTYATGIQVGAPPDPFNQVGQNWSQPPWRPDRLEELGYQPFRDMIASVLRHAGGVRVDHVIGLFRLWWVPEGMRPSEGTYVRYDHEAMVGVLALEAHRAGAVVVGEDLGVVEPSARDYLASRGILGTSILWFERDEEGRPLAAERWRELCLASVTTHDLPPTAGYLAGDHVRLRERLGLLTRPLEEEVAADDAEREAWLAELRHRGLLHDGAGPDEVVRALHAYLALTPARLRCVALTDAVGDRRTQNQPGTTDEYPNWRVPLSGPDEKPLLLEDVLGSERAAELARAVSPDAG
ncbi:MAG: 4-alpha-glucanotransferase [Nocardioidaceae bacterium]|nr:4-alpha-glucanotransferase [Nocardioidaceae bacterium]NUS52157.1 4-alpha-glucanotransferase [Nocardioidaceae bacterium]